MSSQRLPDELGLKRPSNTGIRSRRGRYLKPFERECA